MFDIQQKLKDMQKKKQSKKVNIPVFFIVLIIIFGFWFYNNYISTGDTEQDIPELTVQSQTELSLNDFLAKYEDGDFARVTLLNEIQLKGFQLGTPQTENRYAQLMRRNDDDTVYDLFTAYKPIEVSVTELGISPFEDTPFITEYTKKNGLVAFFVNHVLPLIFFIFLLLLLFRFMGPKGGTMPFNFKVGKLSDKSDSDTKFSDVAGMEEVKQELTEIVDFLQNPEKYHKVGARPPKGVLLYGEPGSGKTLLARAVAGESEVAFYSASGSEFMEMLVGMGASKVRQLFSKAKNAGKAIIFIDEIDAIGKKRGNGYTGGHQEQEQTLNQILTEMDGFDKTTNIVVIAATNRPDTLDPALLRAGRFDRKVYVSRPTYEERLLIFQYYLKDKKYDKNLNIESIAKRTSSFVGADIENIVNEASLKLAREDRKVLTNDDFEYALEKLVMGPEKKIKSIKEKEKRIVTYHELGHAITAHLLPNADPVEKISIVSRGKALGVTWMMPEEDRYLHSRAKFLDEAVTLLGGRAAEEIFFGADEITTGASSDFERATKLMTDLVVKYGMDPDMGPMMYMDSDKGDQSIYRPYSEKTAELIDQKVKGYLETAYQKALKILKDKKADIETMAQVLYKKEYLTKDEFELLMTDISQADKMIADFKKTANKKTKTETIKKKIKKKKVSQPKIIEA